MVSSGLGGQMVSVASHRLAVHLGLAFLILGLIAWYVMKLLRLERDLLQARRQRNPRLAGAALVLLGLGFGQILLGALVAGIDAGRSFPEWPLMAGSFFPPDAFMFEPVWRNFTENAGLVQFNHRMLGYVLLAVGLGVWAMSRRSAMTHIRAAFDAVAVVLLLQVALGIVTVIHAAPVHLALVHQIGAVLLFVLVLRARFAALYPREQKIRRA